MNDINKSYLKNRARFFEIEKIAAPYHKIHLVHKQSTRGRKKIKSNWILKKCEDTTRAFSIEVDGRSLLAAINEVISGELFRFFLGGSQPKTRLVCKYDENNQITEVFVASKLIPKFKKSNMIIKNSKGLAGSLLMSYFLREWDAKAENFYLSGGTIGRFDFEWCFFPLRANKAPHIISRAKITANDLENFPVVRDFRPEFWPVNNNIGSMLCDDREFKREQYKTMLKIFLTPPILISCIIDRSASGNEFDEHKKSIEDTYIEFLSEFRQQCRESKGFCEFFKLNGRDLLYQVISAAKNYCDVEKIDIFELIEEEIRETFDEYETLIRSPSINQ